MKLKNILICSIAALTIAACNNDRPADFDQHASVGVAEEITNIAPINQDSMDSVARVKAIEDSIFYSGPLVTIITSEGVMVFKLYNATPKHRDNFLKLAKNNFYNNHLFHRIIQGFMIQTGDPNSKDNDPNNDGEGGPGYTVPAEFNPRLFHKKGALSAARMPDQVNPGKASSGSQFYIVHGRPFDINDPLYSQMQVTEEAKKEYANKGGAPNLDGAYTVFGEMVQGFETLDKIAAIPVKSNIHGENSVPTRPVKILKVQIN